MLLIVATAIEADNRIDRSTRQPTPYLGVFKTALEIKAHVANRGITPPPVPEIVKTVREVGDPAHIKQFVPVLAERKIIEDLKARHYQPRQLLPETTSGFEDPNQADRSSRWRTVKNVVGGLPLVSRGRG